MSTPSQSPVLWQKTWGETSAGFLVYNQPGWLWKEMDWETLLCTQHWGQFKSPGPTKAVLCRPQGPCNKKGSALQIPQYCEGWSATFPPYLPPFLPPVHLHFTLWRFKTLGNNVLISWAQVSQVGWPADLGQENGSSDLCVWDQFPKGSQVEWMLASQY